MLAIVQKSYIYVHCLVYKQFIIYILASHLLTSFFAGFSLVQSLLCRAQIASDRIELEHLYSFVLILVLD